jgi:ubiquinone/menaquinone biosynthesis C-methylase UbiE
MPSDADTASTPEMWARNFAGSTRMNGWRTFRFGLTREWALIRRHVPAGAAVLDAGCGFGEWVAFLDGKGYRAEGLDYSSELVGRLRRTYPDLSWKNGDIRHLPYHDGVFDAVVSWGVIEHDEAGPQAALREFWRILKPGGVTIVTVPADSPARRRAAEYQFPRTMPGHVFFQYFMTAEDLSAHLRDAGFETIEAAVLPSAIPEIVFPRVAARLRGSPRRVANFVVSTCLSWIPRYCMMRYAVAIKPKSRLNQNRP